MRDDEPTLRDFHPTPRARFIFIPSDYRLLPVMGWRTEKGFEPDEPVNIHEGFLIRVTP